jgi:hypothetical protein
VWTAAIAIACASLAGCGSDSQTTQQNTQTTTRGTLIYDPPFRIASLSAQAFQAELGATSQGSELLQLSGAPVCGVDFYHFEYYTVGGAGETTTASGALMVPTGPAPACSGPRPIVLWGHRTQFNKAVDLANIEDTSVDNIESPLLSAVFAAQGYIVVASNSAGYDTSSLPYHPYLNADQNSKDLIDALQAARTALPHTMSSATSDNGKLFVTGYSAGGFAAMATVRALQDAGKTVTASAPASGPFAIEAMFDEIFFGAVPAGGTLFAPMLVTSYQHAYGDIYKAPTDLYEAQYANGIDAILPSTTTTTNLVASGRLPATALFNSMTPVTGNAALDALLAVPANPAFAIGFGPSNLVTNAYRVSYALDAVMNPDGAVPPAKPGLGLAAAPQHPLRIALKANDMRTAWHPDSPMLMCGGDQDASVFFANTLTMQAYWAALPPGLITVLDVNAPVTPNDPFAAVKVAFQETLAQLIASGGQAAIYSQYHGMVLPFCTAAARGFFSQF